MTKPKMGRPSVFTMISVLALVGVTGHGIYDQLKKSRPIEPRLLQELPLVRAVNSTAYQDGKAIRTYTNVLIAYAYDYSSSQNIEKMIAIATPYPVKNYFWQLWKEDIKLIPIIITPEQYRLVRQGNIIKVRGALQQCSGNLVEQFKVIKAEDLKLEKIGGDSALEWKMTEDNYRLIENEELAELARNLEREARENSCPPN